MLFKTPLKILILYRFFLLSTVFLFSKSTIEFVLSRPFGAVFLINFHQRFQVFCSISLSKRHIFVWRWNLVKNVLRNNIERPLLNKDPVALTLRKGLNKSRISSNEWTNWNESHKSPSFGHCLRFFGYWIRIWI